MAILIDKKTKVIVQGITGKAGSFYTEKSVAYSPSSYVGGVTPGKGGTTHLFLPVFDTVREAKRATGCDATVIYVPPKYAPDAILEAADAEIPLIVCITEGIAIHDMMEVKSALRDSKSRLIGPNTPGVITPDECKMGIMPGFIHKKGSIGLLSRSGTLLFEACDQLTRVGLGQSTCVGIGGDPVIGSNFIDLVQLFNEDPNTDAVLLMGEIGGTAELEAAEWIATHAKKPYFAFIAGKTAPPGRRMGHAGAIVTGGEERADEKIKFLQKSKITIIENPAKIGSSIKKALSL